MVVVADVAVASTVATVVLGIVLVDVIKLHEVSHSVMGLKMSFELTA